MQAPRRTNTLSVRPTYVRHTSNESRAEMGSPLEMQPPADVRDRFDKTPIRGDSMAVAARRIQLKLPRFAQGFAARVGSAAANAAPHWQQVVATGTLVGLTAWVIALTIQARRHNDQVLGWLADLTVQMLSADTAIASLEAFPVCTFPTITVTGLQATAT